MVRRLHSFCLACAVLSTPLCLADTANPVWYQEAGAPGWHYRIPLTLPAAAAAGSTVRVDVDFAAALTTLGIDAGAVDFDESSVRLVDPSGVLVLEQEFTDRVYGGSADAAGNARGEARFILQDTATGHFVYFDVVENGAKPPAPGVNVINGHFELSQGVTPTGWVTSAVSAGGAQNNEVYRTTPGSSINLPAGCSTNGASNLDTGPNAIAGNATGEAWHLLGYRDNCEDATGASNERIRLSRDLDVPGGAAAGVLEFYFNVQGFDGLANNPNQYDWVAVYVNGTSVNHNALGIDNSTNPALRIDSARMGRSGYATSVRDHGWKRARLDLGPWAGTTINFRIESRHSASDNAYRAWVRVDDVIWSRQDATLGAAEGFGVNVFLPVDTLTGPASAYGVGETLVIRTVVDADVSQVTADVVDEGGVTVAAAVPLFDDGSHGDAAAGDRVWSNDGTVAAEPTYTFLTTDTPGSNWLVRVFARDQSVSASGSHDGLLLRAGQPTAPLLQANFHNIDEQTFVLGGAVLEVAKNVVTLSDPGGGSLPKSLPGAHLEYDVRVVNLGPDATDADSLVLVDDVPAETAICVDPICTCTAPCTPGDPVAFDDSASPVPTGLTFTYASDVTYSIDGVDYSYVPVPDGAGFDAAVRFVRVNPGGMMAAPDTAGDPEFRLRYVIRLE